VEGPRVCKWAVWLVSGDPGELVFDSVPLAHMGSQVAERTNKVVSHTVGNVCIGHPC